MENSKVRRVLLVLEQNMSRSLSTDELARHVNLSPRQLERLFQRETGESIQKLYRNMRLSYGLWLLQNSNRKITEIAQDCGFSDTAHFSRAFRSAFGKTPTEQRRA